MAPKYRPIECYQNSILPEDMDELKRILFQMKNGGDDKEFANLLGDMFDKKRFREKPSSQDEKKELDGCGMAPQYLPVECYENYVLRRDKKIIKDAYDKYHKKDINKFMRIYLQLIEKKLNYYNPKE